MTVLYVLAAVLLAVVAVRLAVVAARHLRHASRRADAILQDHATRARTTNPAHKENNAA